MKIFSEILYVVHVIALSLAAGAAIVKMLLVFRCKKNYRFYNDYFKLAPMLSKLIIAGMVLLTVSGIAWIFTGYSVNSLLIIKIVLVAGIWVLGPLIDGYAEPKIKKFLPFSEQAPAQEFFPAQKLHLRLEVVATILMYAVLIIGVLL